MTLVEAAPRLLARVAAPETAGWFRDLHRAHGVDLREGTGLETLLGDEAGHVTGAVLTCGTRLDVDFVIVGVGIRPETRLAEAAGLTIDDGVAVDAFGRTSATGVWAAGDCASFPCPTGLGTARRRLESVPHAIDHAEAVADNILGAAEPYVPRPWFWSDQYGVKLQIAGLNVGHDAVVERGAPPEAAEWCGRSLWYYRGDTLLAVDAMNDPRAYMVGKRLIEAGRSPAKSAVAEAGDVKSLLR